MIPALKVWRLAKGLTVLQASELFGVTFKTVYKWEAGVLPRSIPLLARIELVTGMTLHQLFPEYFNPL
jgi:transcriptional regulator with XRE-family HTH domain